MNGAQTVRRWTQERKTYLGAVGVTALAMVAFTAWCAHRVDLGMRKDLLDQARMVSQALNLEDVAALTGDPADTATVPFQRIEQHLSAVRSIGGFRYVYLMAARPAAGQGQRREIVFLLDAQDETLEPDDASLPGDPYEEASDELRALFEGGAALLEGPAPDRWGVWMSALVPLRRTGTSPVLAVLGLDIEAGDWRWEVAAKTALPVGLALVLAISAFSFWGVALRRNPTPEPVLRRLLPSLAAVVAVVIAGFAFLLLQSHAQRMAEASQLVKQHTSRELRQALDQQAHGLEVLLETQSQDTPLAEWLAQGRMEDLRGRLAPWFEHLRQRDAADCGSVLGPDGACLLPLSGPETNGPASFAVRKSMQTGHAARGLELDRDGVCAMRVSVPLRTANRVVGYLELGREVESTLRTVSRKSGVDLAMLLNKHYLDRAAWEARVKTLGAYEDWDHLPNHVVLYSSRPLPQEVRSLIAQGIPESNPAPQAVPMGERRARVLFDPWEDASGEPVADLMLLHDVTALVAANNWRTTVSLVSSAVLFTLLMGFLYVLLRNTDAGIAAQQRALRESESGFRNLFHKSPVAIQLRDAKTGEVADANAAAYSAYGFHTLEDFRNAKPSDERPYALEDALCHLRKAAQGEPQRFEWKSRKATGEVFWEDVSLVGIAIGGKEQVLATSIDITDRKATAERTRALAQCLLEFGADSDENINRLAALCGSMLGATCALYNRLEDGFLCAIGQWQTPPDFPPSDRPEGHLCHDVIRRTADGPLVVRNLQQTAYADTDPNVRAYGLQTYIGTAVKCRDQAVGSLCVVFQSDFAPTESILDFLQLAGFAAAVEEERRQATSSLAESEELQRMLIENVDVGIVLINPDNHEIEQVNPHAARLFGSVPEQIVGKECHRFLCPAERGKCPVTDQHLEVDNAERIMITAQGEEVPVLKSVRRVTLGGRDLLLETFVDIRVRKKAEAELQRLTRMHEVLTGMAMTYISLPIEQADAAIKTSLGELGSLVGADRVYLFDYHFAESFCRNTHEWCREGIEPQINDLQAVPLEMIPDWVATHRVGKVMQVADVSTLPETSGIRQVLEPQSIRSLIAVPMMDGAQCIGFVGFDSVRKLHVYSDAEQRLLTVFAEMLVNLRSRRRMSEALRKSREDAETASRAKGEFLANMSHEIRTPMNGVIGMLNLLLDSELDDEQKRFARTARSSADALLSLINDILDISKIEAGKLELEALDFILRDVLDESVAPLAFRAQQKGVEFIVGVDPQIPERLRGDPSRLRQVLTNLAGNAVKFTDQGEVSLRVDLCQPEPDDPATGSVRLKFTVRDTGIGIAPGQADQLFTKFTQVDSSTTRRYGGSGLGLAIAKQLAELMGGSIGVESKEGQGSTFWFFARFDLAEETSDSLLLRPQLRALVGARILVVDDNETNRQVMKAQLRAWNMRPDTVGDGPDALCAMHQACEDGDAYRVALLDMQMPSMDGMSLARVIKKDPVLAGIPLILFTSMIHRDIGREAQAAGFTAWLTKPVRQSDLLDRISEAILGHQYQEPKEEEPPPSPARPTGDRKPARILLVEDNMVNRLVELGLLTKLGHAADCAENGKEAVEALARKSYDLVFMDVQMPVMDGIEATQRIRAIGIAPNRGPGSKKHAGQIPIIAMTAHAMRGDREKCLAAGMDDYISKPIAMAALADMLRKWLVQPE